MTPPDLLPFSAFDGDWNAYENELHQIFMAEIARANLRFRGQRVSCRRIPEAGGALGIVLAFGAGRPH